VRLLVENLTSEPTTPAHLLTILEMGHLDQVGVCLDLGHAHLTVGIEEAIATLDQHIASVHVHDNDGLKDEHLWPGDGTIAWAFTAGALKALPSAPATVLEISQNLPDTPAQITTRASEAFSLFD
jgi:sugar phosphate isomerase/epimerase